MNIWEKAILNMQKGSSKITVAAATFSERVKAELAMIRLRIRIDEVQARIDGLHRLIGRKVMDLKKQEALPKTMEQLLKVDDTMAAMTELADREQEIEELKEEMKNIRSEFKATTKEAEDTIA
jgi:predicted  nucleic acid-binding Zn-ribbon protein